MLRSVPTSRPRAMYYPAALRYALGRLPVTANIDGKAKMNVLRALDPLFRPAAPRQHVEVAGSALSLDTAQSAERLLYYAPENVLRHAEASPLYTLIRQVFRHRPGLFVDVGANLGLYSLLARRHGAEAVLFEPEPVHLDFLQRNSEHLGRIVPLALSDYQGTAAFHVGDPHHSGASSLCEGEGEGTGAIYTATVEVEVTTFDAWVEEHLGAERVELVKVDVEGHEAATLRGMTGYLARPDAAPVWCEVRGPDSDRGGNSYREATDLLAPLGYRPFVMEKETPRPFHPARDVRQVFDLLFLAPERHGYLLAR